MEYSTSIISRRSSISNCGVLSSTVHDTERGEGEREEREYTLVELCTLYSVLVLCTVPRPQAYLFAGGAKNEASDSIFTNSVW